MPDWQKLVREKLSMLKLPPDAKEEVISELAAHLEDDYQNEIARGIGEPEATQQVLSEVRWSKLAREIKQAVRKEQSMNNRTRTLWLPAVVNLVAATVLMILLVAFGVDDHMTRSSYFAIAQLSIDHPHHARLFVFIYKILEITYLSWFLTLPFSSAVGCLMARRAQASPKVRLIVGLAPSFLWLAVFAAMSLTFELDRWQFPAGFPLEFSDFAFAALGWIVLPIVPLLMGTLPFLKESNLRRSQAN